MLSPGRFRIEKATTPDGGFELFNDELGKKVGHYYESRRFVERVVAIRQQTDIPLPQVYQLVKREGY